MEDKKRLTAEELSSHVKVSTLKRLLETMPVQRAFSEALMQYLDKKGLLQKETCHSLTLGILFAEFINANVDPNSDEDMRNYYISRAILSNTDKLPLIQEGS